MDLRSVLEQAPKRVERFTFGEGGMAFQVDVQMISRRDVEHMRRRVTKRVAERGPNGQRGGWKDEVDLPAFRAWLRDACLVSWSGLTLRKVLAMTNRTCPEGLEEQLDTDLEFQGPDNTRPNVDLMLEEARGRFNGDLVSFEDFVWGRVTDLAAERDEEEAREKNGSGSTPGATLPG